MDPTGFCEKHQIAKLWGPISPPSGGMGVTKIKVSECYDGDLVPWKNHSSLSITVLAVLTLPHRRFWKMVEISHKSLFDGKLPRSLLRCFFGACAPATRGPLVRSPQTFFCYLRMVNTQLLTPFPFPYPTPSPPKYLRHYLQPPP